MSAIWLAAGCACLALLPGAPAFAQEPSPRARETFFNARYLEARLHMGAGEWEQARQALETCRPADGCPAAVFELLARVCSAQGKVDEALRAVEDGLERYPTSVELLIGHALLQREKGRISEAIDDLNRALEQSPNRQDVLEMLSELHLSRLISNPANSQEELRKLIEVYDRMLASRVGHDRIIPLLVLSTLYQKVDEMEKAVEVSAEALRISPDLTGVQEAHASALVAAGREGEAIELYRRALVGEPGNEDVRRKLEALLLQEGGEAGRSRFFIELAADNLDNAGVQQISASVLIKAKRWPEAEGCLRALLQLKPEDVPNKLLLLHVWIEMGRLDDAVAEAKRMGDSGGELAPAITLSFAESLENQGHRREALELLETYHSSHPLNENVALGLVSLLIEDDQQEKAMGLLEKVKAQSPENFLAVALLSEVYAGEGRFDEAHAMLGALPEPMRERHARDLALIRAGLYINQSVKAEDDEQHEGAIAFLDRALELLDGVPESGRPQDRQRMRGLRTGVWLNRALILQRRGETDDAEAAYRKALDLNPDDAETWNSLGYFYAQTGQKLDEAHLMILRALELKPDAPHILDSLGWVLYCQGRFDEALPHLERAARELSDEPSSAEIYDHLGDAYSKLDRSEDARKAWSRALELKGEVDLKPIRAKLEQTQAVRP
jgi:tetratricopeptide (TPR) repeat protein